MKITITIIHPDHPGEIYLLNEKGDVYTAKCSKLIEFIRRAVTPADDTPSTYPTAFQPSQE